MSDKIKNAKLTKKIDETIEKLKNGIYHAHEIGDVFVYNFWGQVVSKRGEDAKNFYRTSANYAELLIKILEHAKYPQNAELAKGVQDIIGRHGYNSDTKNGKKMIYLDIPDSLGGKICDMARKVDIYRENQQKIFNNDFEQLF